MDKRLNIHEVYMGLAFRPFIKPDGSVGRVGVQAGNVACVDPECYPNLVTAAPAMYQALALLVSAIDRKSDHGQGMVDAIEAVMSFAQNGYIGGLSVDDIISRLKR